MARLNFTSGKPVAAPTNSDAADCVATLSETLSGITVQTKLDGADTATGNADFRQSAGSGRVWIHAGIVSMLRAFFAEDAENVPGAIASLSHIETIWERQAATLYQRVAADPALAAKAKAAFDASEAAKAAKKR